MSVPRPCSSKHGIPDVVVLGAGLIGLATALELHDRGATVNVVDSRQAIAGASIAAAGMLAAEDPFNPPEIRPLSRWSVERYPRFLRRIEELSGIAVPFQTRTTVQYLANGNTIRLAEQSLDPRQLASALAQAVNQTSIRLLQNTRVQNTRVQDALMQNTAPETTERAFPEVRLQCSDSTGSTTEIVAKIVVNAAGAWARQSAGAIDCDPLPITPRKGQMLRVRLPSTLALREVHRSERIYIVPRTTGPGAGTALIGATVEDAGFDTAVHMGDLRRLRASAAELLPELGSETQAPFVESWAGLRPFAPDGLPVIGQYSRAGTFVATGHYRNGILLAPATAMVLADLVEGKHPPVDVAAFSPARFLVR